MTSDTSAMLAIARSAAALGAELLGKAELREVAAKGDRDFVTDLDLRIEEEVRRYLAEATPTVGFLGEETASAGSDPQDAGAMWVLDPIDGTSNFIHGLPLSAVALALLQHGETTVGVIVAPFLGLEYYAERAGGAFVNGKAMGPLRARELRGSIVSLGDYAVGADSVRRNRERIALTAALADSVERIRMFGSAALDLAWVAEGRTDACVILSNKPWDTAAGVLIARESGALVTDSAGLPHTISSADTVAANASISTELLTLIANVS